MNFRMIHENYNVSDLARSMEFYEQALGLHESRRKTSEDFTIVYMQDPTGSFEIVYLGDGQSEHLLELTWLRDWDRPYDLGDNEFHLALETDDYAAAHQKHEKMGCICYENPGMGIYFIEDPDGYWLEIVPERK